MSLKITGGGSVDKAPPLHDQLKEKTLSLLIFFKKMSVRAYFCIFYYLFVTFLYCFHIDIFKIVLHSGFDLKKKILF